MIDISRSKIPIALKYFHSLITPPASLFEPSYNRDTFNSFYTEAIHINYVKMPYTDVDWKAINTIRVLAVRNPDPDKL